MPSSEGDVVTVVTYFESDPLPVEVEGSRTGVPVMAKHSKIVYLASNIRRKKYVSITSNHLAKTVILFDLAKLNKLIHFKHNILRTVLGISRRFYPKRSFGQNKSSTLTTDLARYNFAKSFFCL